MVEERAAAFAKRSIKTSAKLAGLKLVTSMMDLTTLEGKDTPGKIAFLCRKAMQPLDSRYEVPLVPQFVFIQTWSESRKNSWATQLSKWHQSQPPFPPVSCRCG